MRLNPDCIRDILLAVEHVCDFHNEFSYPATHERLEKYSQEVVLYHIRQCEMSGFFRSADMYISGDYSISDLSPLGHQFLEDIRTDSTWNEVKTKAGKVGSFSLGVLQAITAGVVTALINKQFGL